MRTSGDARLREFWRTTRPIANRLAMSALSSKPTVYLLAVVTAFVTVRVSLGDDAAPADEASATKPFQLGNLITPFTPPPLEELEKTAEWIDKPVLDGFEVLRKKQQESGPPRITEQEALALRNDSPENGKKILDTLGRLPPADGSGVDYDTSWVRHVTGDLKSSNPLFISSITEFEFLAMTGFEYLSYDRDINYFMAPEYVKSWQTSKDGLMDKIVLRDDIVWSDGKPITAHDIKFSYQVIMSDQVPIPAVRTGADQLKWVEAYDDRTVVF